MQSDREIREILDRTRRTETRVTKIGRAMGIDVGGGQPEWNGEEGKVIIPSPNCSIGAIINVVPVERRADDIDVFINSDYMMTIFSDKT